jgi:hypothetical protein
MATMRPFVSAMATYYFELLQAAEDGNTVNAVPCTCTCGAFMYSQPLALVAMYNSGADVSVGMDTVEKHTTVCPIEQIMKVFGSQTMKSPTVGLLFRHGNPNNITQSNERKIKKE